MNGLKTMKNKEIQLTVNIGSNDRIRKAKQTAKFLEKGNGVQVRLRLKRGRESGRTSDAASVMEQFLEETGAKDNKYSAPKWNDVTLTTFIHP